MKPLAKIILWLRIAKFYKNGSGFGFVWNWFNPLSWFIAPIFFLTSVFLEGIIETWEYRHQIGFGIAPYFKKHPDRLVWLKSKKR
jgi:hypothetical protein